MASFSRLVAGIAHEINTPIGVCVTMSSYLIEASNQLEEAYHTQKLSKRKFDEYLNKITEISQLLLDNLMKSGEMITAFKTASSNNFTFDLYDYNMYELTDNLLKSLKSQTRNKAIDFVVDMAFDLTIRSYPSAMSQILTNLIANAISHGFKDRDHGQIIISSRYVDKKLLVTVEDNGCGIEPGQMSSIFEPFVTTNRVGGGMGLGLSIIQNLVVNKLGGTIKVKSSINSYTRFEVMIDPIET